MTSPRLLTRDGFGELLEQLRARGYTLIGPRVRDGAISYEEIGGVEDLPRGVSETQRAGHYQLGQSSKDFLFDFASTAQSFKHVFHPPRQQLFSLKRSAGGAELIPPAREERRFALIGARGCDIAALWTLDGVFVRGTPADPGYVARRRDTFVVAINCTMAGGTCFCTSMDTGPSVEQDFDVALTELECAQGSEFVAESGSELGRELLGAVSTTTATDAQVTRADESVEAVRKVLGKRIEAHGLRELLQSHAEHPIWQSIAERCLACANCTMACPTCFCSNTTDEAGWDGEEHRTRSWDSCFTGDFSYLHGGAVRTSTAARYRQWMTHKLSTWFDQFGSSGCVGCGRCITWCPAGIDITEEVNKLRAAVETTAEAQEDG